MAFGKQQNSFWLIKGWCSAKVIRVPECISVPPSVSKVPNLAQKQGGFTTIVIGWFEKTFLVITGQQRY